MLLQTVPSWGGGCRGHTAGRISPPAQARQKEREKVLARNRARTRLWRSCWHACPPQARHSRALLRLRLPTGTGTCGVQAAPPRTAQAVPRCPMPPLHNHGEPAQACALPHGAGMGPRGASLQPHQGFCHPGRSLGWFPLLGALHPLSPLSPGRMETCQRQSPACRRGQGLRIAGTGSMLGWRPQAGCSGGYAMFPIGLWSPAPCPDTQPQAFAGVRK